MAIEPQQPALRFVNLGKAGDTTGRMLKRAGDVMEYGDHELIVMLGCNDVPRDEDRSPHLRTSLTEYESNLRSLLPVIQGSHSLLVSSFPVCYDRTGVRMETLKTYIDVAMSVARACGYEVWDLFGEVVNENTDQYLAPDGLHFNARGHEMIGGSLVNAFALDRHVKP